MPGLLLALGYLCLLVLAVRHLGFFRVHYLTVRTTGLLLVLKVAAGIALWAVYTYVHTDRATADLYKYFDDGAVMFSALPDRPLDYLRMLTGIGNDTQWFTDTYYTRMNNWFRTYDGNLYNDSHTMIRFNALVRLFSFGHIHVHTVFAAFLAFTGLFAIMRSMAPFLPGREPLVAAIVFMLPSVLFWGSGVIKESLLFFGIGMLLNTVLCWVRIGFRWWMPMLLAFTLPLLFFLKFYVLLSMLPGLLALVWCMLKPGRTGSRFALVYALFALAALSIHWLIPGFNILEVLVWKYRDFIGLATSTGSGSYVAPPPLEPTLWSYLMAAPHALYITLLGPLVHGWHGLLPVLAALETALLPVAIVLLLRRRLPTGQVCWPLVLFCLGFVVLLSLVIGYTTPVIGAIVRYRTPLLPFLLLAALAFTDVRRWDNSMLRSILHR